ncbi:MAG: long-chain fatty acid transporter [Telmatospirillum sp.]|nr:long-chain fatty acid transporter [Telmatospirillum sp.]
MRRLSALLAGLSLTLAAAAPAEATEGYFEHGYGTQAKGMAGANLAYPTDSLAIATNPASAVVLEDRLDIDADYFIPFRHASITGNAFGGDQTYSGNNSKAFVIPEFGVIHHLSETWAAGFAVYGNGGMDTAYATNPYGRFGATGKAGVDLQQLFLSPTLAYRFARNQSIGLSVNVVDQLFKAQGIGAFGGFSGSPQSVSDTGRDSAFGAGVRVGWQGRLVPWLTLAAAWQSKTYSEKFDKYKGLFAQAGAFDVPATWGVGAAIKTPLPGLDVSLEVRQILYSGVPSIANSFQRLVAGQPLGGGDGPGFGWKDATIEKIGLNYRLSPDWQVRAGYAHTAQPIPAGQTFLNILAPGVIEHEVTAGATWQMAPHQEISVYALYALPNTVHGAGSIPGGFPPAGFGGGNAAITLSELSVGVGYGWRF